MKYRVLMSEEPVPDIETVARLEELGLKVPFVPSDLDINIYAYFPAGENLDLRRVRAVHPFYEAYLEIDERELIHHQNKINQYNSVSKGDLVRISGYKNLVTEVESIEGNLVTTRINLRGYVFRFINNMNQLIKSDVIYRESDYDLNHIHDETIYVDMSECSLDTKETYIRDAFNLVIRIKLFYPKYNLAIINPLFDFDKMFGLVSISGAVEVRDLINAIGTSKAIFYTRDLSLYRSDRKFICKIPYKHLDYLEEMNDISFKKITGLTSGNDLRVLHLLRDHHANTHSKLIFDEDKVCTAIKTRDSRFLKEYAEFFAPDKHSYRTLNKGDFRVSRNKLDMESLYKILLDEGYISIVENLDYYMKIIRG